MRRLNLQYRNRLEFAIGRTCSVDWAVATGARRASAVSTTWLPVAETPQTQARSVEDALLSMDGLATADTEGLRAGLEPLMTGYGDWLDEQEDAAGSCRSTCARPPSWCSGRPGRLSSGSPPAWSTSSAIPKRYGASSS